jgi:hypothetical protein
VTNSPMVLVFFVVGLLIYAALLFWAGKRGLLWLAILLSLPALMGGAMRLFGIDVPPDASPLARHFGWLVLVQLTVGVIFYSLGGANSARKVRDTQV